MSVLKEVLEDKCKRDFMVYFYGAKLNTLVFMNYYKRRLNGLL